MQRFNGHKFANFVVKAGQEEIEDQSYNTDFNWTGSCESECYVCQSVWTNDFFLLLTWRHKFAVSVVAMSVYIQAWVDIIDQLATFFKRCSHFSESAIQCIRDNKSFAMCQSTCENVNDLLEPLSAQGIVTLKPWQ